MQGLPSPAAAYSASISTSALTSPVDGLGSPGELMCPSEALTAIQSRAGRAAAVAAAVRHASMIDVVTNRSIIRKKTPREFKFYA